MERCFRKVWVLGILGLSSLASAQTQPDLANLDPKDPAAFSTLAQVYLSESPESFGSGPVQRRVGALPGELLKQLKETSGASDARVMATQELGKILLHYLRKTAFHLLGDLPREKRTLLDSSMRSLLTSNDGVDEDGGALIDGLRAATEDADPRVAAMAQGITHELRGLLVQIALEQGEFSGQPGYQTRHIHQSIAILGRLQTEEAFEGLLDMTRATPKTNADGQVLAHDELARNLAARTLMEAAFLKNSVATAEVCGRLLVKRRRGPEIGEKRR